MTRATGRRGTRIPARATVRAAATALTLLLAGSVAGCSAAPADPLAGITVTPGAGTVWIALFGPEPDLGAAKDITDWDKRGRFVVDELHRVAATAQ